MYGLMHIALRDIVTEKLGVNAWKEICGKHGASVCPISLESYPDNLTESILAETAARLELQMPEMLKEFGRHWIGFILKGEYGDILRFYGPDFRSCIENLNTLHASVGGTMQSAHTPNFKIVSSDTRSVVVRYSSKRQGLTPLVEGLLAGLLLHFDLNGSVKIIYSEVSHTDFHVALNT